MRRDAAAGTPAGRCSSPSAALTAAFFRELADRPQNGNADIYWMDASFLERLRPSGDPRR